jgi:hypothetical protein
MKPRHNTSEGIMAIPEIIAQAKQVDIADLVGRYVSLQRVSSHEWEGPCPQCGGDDRLHCTEEWWFCRQCHPKRGDAIDFLRHATGCSFQDATERLTNQQWPERKPHRQEPKAQRVDDRLDSWFDDAAHRLHQQQLALPGSLGAEYLRGRGLLPATWAAFGLGFGYAPNRDTNTELPAVAIPWFRAGRLTAIRYRFLQPAGKQKITSLPGSKFGSLLFGGQALPDWATWPEGEGADLHRLCTLILCEGEINAMSIWQVTQGQRVHVMSLGSESSRLSAGAVAFAERYGRVIIWMDKPDVAKALRGQVADAHACYSPEGKDANDLLQAGILGAFLVEQRWLSTRTSDERLRLLYDLWDAAYLGEGLDGSTATAYAKLCEVMHRPFDLVEAEPGRWVTLRVAGLHT